ncbi:type II toxin-antitoxin system VapC family toxin [soil metagenome]
MRRLLDTHVMYWLLFNTGKVPELLRLKLTSEPNVSYSVVSLREMALKKGNGKLSFPIPFSEVDRRLSEFYLFQRLDILPFHLDKLTSLPIAGHKDPFDRLLVSQAIAENMTFVTRDTSLSSYPVRTEWQ